MPAPRIGLTVGRVGRAPADESPYSAAIAAAGGQPEWVDPERTGDSLRAWFEGLDGLVLTGGGDIHPARYGAHTGPNLSGLDCRRDDLEITLAGWALEAGLPLLGICRGHQLLNVAHGGTLIQDIPTDVPHAGRHDAPRAGEGPVRHAVHLRAGSRLRELIGGTSLVVNSYHHQAVCAVGQGVLVSAAADDGIIEGIEVGGHPFALGVQWHPERMPDAPSSRALFAGLTRAAGRR